MIFPKELIRILKEKKKYWLFPMIFILVLFSVLTILSEGVIIPPFFYTIFD